MAHNKRPVEFLSLTSRPGHLIRRLHQIHVALFLEECSEFNVTPVQFAVLTVLYDNDALDQISIASQSGVDRNTTADVIRRLERRGLIERPISRDDKRVRLAKITKAGRKFVEAVQPAMIRAQKRFVEPLGTAEYREMMTLLDKLVQANNEASRAPIRDNGDETN